MEISRQYTWPFAIDAAKVIFDTNGQWQQIFETFRGYKWPMVMDNENTASQTWPVVIDFRIFNRYAWPIYDNTFQVLSQMSTAVKLYVREHRTAKCTTTE